MTWTKSHRQRSAISRAVKHRKAMVMEVERLIGEGAKRSIALVKSIQSKHQLSLHEAFQIVADADRRAAAKGGRHEAQGEAVEDVVRVS